MAISAFPVIDLTATGNNIKRLRLERGLTVRQVQSFFGFEEPQAIYKWQRGESLPSVDNLFALGRLLDVPMDEILVPVTAKLHMVREQQGEPCCSHHFFDFWASRLWIRQTRIGLRPFFRSPLSPPADAGGGSGSRRSSEAPRGFLFVIHRDNPYVAGET